MSETPESQEITTSYDLFMSAVDHAEAADNARDRSKWLRIAQDEYQVLVAHNERLSSAQRRRAQRAFEYLQELAQKK